MSCCEDHLPRFDGAKLCQQGVMKDSNSQWLLIIMKMAFRTVLRVIGPSFNLHILPSHMHTYAGASLKVTFSLSLSDACRCRICIWMPTFVGKFKGAWRFCPFSLNLSRPMGTTSHTSKALPASIITKRVGLMVFHWATFRSGCVYLSFPARFLYVSITKKTQWQSVAGSRSMRRSFLDSSAAVSVAPLSLFQYRRSVNLAFMFHLHTNCFCFVLSHLSAFFFHTFAVFSLRLRLSLFFHRPYKTRLIKMRAFAMTHSSGTNKCFLPPHSCLKALCIVFIGVK